MTTEANKEIAHRLAGIATDLAKCVDLMYHDNRISDARLIAEAAGDVAQVVRRLSPGMLIESVS